MLRMFLVVFPLLSTSHVPLSIFLWSVPTRNALSPRFLPHPRRAPWPHCHAAPLTPPLALPVPAPSGHLTLGPSWWRSRSCTAALSAPCAGCPRAPACWRVARPRPVSPQGRRAVLPPPRCTFLAWRAGFTSRLAGRSFPPVRSRTPSSWPLHVQCPPQPRVLCAIRPVGSGSAVCRQLPFTSPAASPCTPARLSRPLASPRDHLRDAAN